MPERIFRLLERLQRLDDFLRDAQRRSFADPLELARLRRLKAVIKSRLAAFAAPRQQFRASPGATGVRFSAG